MRYTLTSKALPILLASILASAAHGATTTVLQADEAKSEDVFVYEFAIPGFFGIPTAARVTNLDSQTLNELIPPPVPFGNFLGSSNTVPLIGALGETRAHDTRSLLRFDLGTLGFSAGQILNARLNLFALPGLAPFDNPTTGKPITTELHRVTQAWGETTVTWETQPTVAVTFSSTVQEGVNQWVSFDLTGLLQDWLSDPTTNFGVELLQPDIVIADSGRPIASLYASSASANAATRPFLEISAIPEPSTFALLAGSLGVVGWTSRLRRGVRVRIGDTCAGLLS
ncbi:DNRLRE domain-containing protein [Accumulibacter sp.]|uniref:DNRLRE domain-containing protein n=2 Tax=Accumulibacter sp. TaxID=2053492 RepID=UPI002C9E0CE1|nr:DNRLRE domain-containing protein [Accumulibacter sp.]HNC20010.1 DNRLRE domain-containing protein [Accumulibacter sp.]